MHDDLEALRQRQAREPADAALALALATALRRHGDLRAAALVLSSCLRLRGAAPDAPVTGPAPGLLMRALLETAVAVPGPLAPCLRCDLTTLSAHEPARDGRAEPRSLTLMHRADAPPGPDALIVGWSDGAIEALDLLAGVSLDLHLGRDWLSATSVEADAACEAVVRRTTAGRCERWWRGTRRWQHQHVSAARRARGVDAVTWLFADLSGRIRRVAFHADDPPDAPQPSPPWCPQSIERGAIWTLAADPDAGAIAVLHDRAGLLVFERWGDDAPCLQHVDSPWLSSRGRLSDDARRAAVLTLGPASPRRLLMCDLPGGERRELRVPFDRVRAWRADAFMNHVAFWDTSGELALVDARSGDALGRWRPLGDEGPLDALPARDGRFILCVDRGAQVVLLA